MLISCDRHIILHQKKNLLNMNRHQLKSFFSSLGEESFRADQVMKWIYHYYCDDFDCMTDIRKSLREKLKECAEIRSPVIVNRYYSRDGTIKLCFQIGNEKIETVYIPKCNRSTVCVSSQVGCTLQCTFCATGQQGFSRNLRVFEIIGQIWSVAKMININKSIWRPQVTNVVMMGMGEPLLNFNNVVTSVGIILDNFGFGLSKRRVTLSTAGVVPAINKLSNEGIDVSLAISLHAPNDFIRNKIMPINKKWNIRSLLTSVRDYLSRSKNRYVTIEYIMLDHVNDCVSCAHQLVKCLQNLPCKINLIPWNFIPGSRYCCSSKVRINQFVKILLEHGLVVTVRDIRGDDINAACGQLAGVVVDRKHKSRDAKGGLIAVQ